LQNRQEKSLFSDGRNRKKKWITDKEIKFLGGAKPTSYYIIYPDDLHTVKKIAFFLPVPVFPVDFFPSGKYIFPCRW